MKYVKLFEQWDNSYVSIKEENRVGFSYDDEWDSNWSDSIEFEDDPEPIENMKDEEYPDDEWDSNWSDR